MPPTTHLTVTETLSAIDLFRASKDAERTAAVNSPLITILPRGRHHAKTQKSLIELERVHGIRSRMHIQFHIMFLAKLTPSTDSFCVSVFRHGKKQLGPLVFAKQCPAKMFPVLN
jgi:hypothetical protein